MRIFTGSNVKFLSIDVITTFRGKEDKMRQDTHADFYQKYCCGKEVQTANPGIQPNEPVKPHPVGRVKELRSLMTNIRQFFV